MIEYARDIVIEADAAIDEREMLMAMGRVATQLSDLPR